MNEHTHMLACTHKHMHAWLHTISGGIKIKIHETGKEKKLSGQND